MNSPLETLVDLFDSFPSHGDRPALIHRTGVRRRVMTYADLHAQSLRMAGWLRGQGVAPGSRVLLWAPNSPWWGVAFWGCVASGVVVVPVDFMAGRERADTIARLTDASLIIQSRSKGEPLENCRATFFEDLQFVIADAEPPQILSAPDPQSTAELIYTSGTTGAPKGVVLTHANLMANLRQVTRHIPVVEAEYRFLSCLPLSHMFEQMGGFFTPLSRGAAIVYLRTLKPSAIMEAFSKEGLHAMVAVPRLLQLLKNAIERELAAHGLGSLYSRLDRMPPMLRSIVALPVRRKFGDTFQLFVSGGAALSPDLFRFWSNLGFRVLEGYGLSECSPVLAANRFDRQVPGSVGVPLPGVEIRFEGGELLARGDNVFPGYYGNEEATRQAFTPDGWFRTGDLGEVDTDGFVHLKGRSKELIVTGAGINVYPDEVEEILNRVRGVRESCVLGLDRGAGEEVHAVIIPDESGRSLSDMVQEANTVLDELQRITGFSAWPEPDFPKTTTMKVQKFLVRKRLMAGRIDEGAVAGDRLKATVAAVTGAPVAEITEESCLVSDLGLTSIARLELVNALEQEFRLDLDDALIGPETRIRDLRGVVERRDKVTCKLRFRSWANSGPARLVRRLCDRVIHFPLLGIFIELGTGGGERLDSLTQPVIFIANHVSYFDQPVIMRALPQSWRYNTATAVWAEFFFRNFRNVFQKIWKRFTYDYGTFALNLFPLPQSQGFRSSLVHMGSLVDRGINLLVFPEGERSLDGNLLPFQQGLGIMAKELEIPVVPVKIRGLERVFPRGALWPKWGSVTVTFGEPLRFGVESPKEIVAMARKAIEEL